MQKAAVIGLDGAAWHLVDPLINAGHMPNLGALKQAGAAGTLASTVPTYTPPAWTSAATGVNPGRHGIYGFIEGHAQNKGLELVHSGKIKSPTIWEGFHHVTPLMWHPVPAGAVVSASVGHA